MKNESRRAIRYKAIPAEQAFLKLLIADASKYYRDSKKLFEEDDNHEDMTEMYRWKNTVGWLKSYL